MGIFIITDEWQQKPSERRHNKAIKCDSTHFSGQNGMGTRSRYSLLIACMSLGNFGFNRAKYTLACNCNSIFLLIYLPTSIKTVKIDFNTTYYLVRSIYQSDIVVWVIVIPYTYVYTHLGTSYDGCTHLHHHMCVYTSENYLISIHYHTIHTKPYIWTHRFPSSAIFCCNLLHSAWANWHCSMACVDSFCKLSVFDFSSLNSYPTCITNFKNSLMYL